MRWLVTVSLFATLFVAVNAVDKVTEQSDDQRLLQLLRRLQTDLEQRDSAAEKVEEKKTEEKKEEEDIHLPVEKDEEKKIEKDQPVEKAPAPLDPDLTDIADESENQNSAAEQKTYALKADSNKSTDPAGDILPHVMELLIQLLNDCLNLTLSHVPPKSGAVETVERRKRQVDESATTPAPQPSPSTTPAPSTQQSNPVVLRMLQKLGELEYFLAIYDFLSMYPPTQTTSSRSKLGVAHLLETQKRSQPVDAVKTDRRVELAKLLDKYVKH
jgi:hypothetical protein